MKAIIFLFLLSASACAATQQNSQSHTVSREDSVPGHVSAQWEWFISTLNSNHSQLSEAEIIAHFHPSFLGQVPSVQLLATVQSFRQQLAPVTVNSLRYDAASNLLEGIMASKVGTFSVNLAVDSASGLITGLLVKPQQLPVAPALTFDEAKSKLQSMGGLSGLSFFEIKGEKCSVLYDHNASTRFALGSAFKLFVLSALEKSVAKGNLSWNQSLAVRDEWKSLPSGTVQNDAAGTQYSLEHFAQKMISISDNTATDHLIHSLTRAEVEGAVPLSARPFNSPFLTTRELFTLKSNANLRKEFLEISSPKVKTDFLDEKVSPLAFDMKFFGTWVKPIAIDKVEWFASGEELCETFRDYKDLKSLNILSANPGIPELTAKFDYVGFKGGSEPGVMSLNFLLKKSERTYVLTLTANHLEQDINQAAVIDIVRGLKFDL